MKILLQPSSGPEAMAHFEDTIENGVSMELLRNKLPKNEFEKLKELGETKVKVWGMVPTKEGIDRSEWRNLNEGDWVIFYAKKGFYYIAKVYMKVHNAGLASTLWGTDKNGKTWEYIYFIKEGKQIQVKYEPTKLGYALNHVIYGAMLLDEEKSNIMKGLLEESEGKILEEDQIEPTEVEENELIRSVKEPKTPEEAEKEIIEISKNVGSEPVEERIKTAKILSRNPKFSRLIKEKSKYVCEICGAQPFTKPNGMPYAEAHHKEELAKSRIDNPSIMICVCPTCHKVIHYGDNKSLEDRKKLKAK